MTQTRATRLSIRDGRWCLNGAVTYPGTRAEGLLMNVRMVNAVFEDRNPQTCPVGFDPAANTAAFIARLPEYLASGVRAFTLCLQGGSPGYEGALNSAFESDGALREPYLARVRRVIEACDRLGAAVILGCYYQRQDQVLRDEAAIRAGVRHVAAWIRDQGFANVILEIANEFAHAGFAFEMLRRPEDQAALIELARTAAPGLLVSTSGTGSGRLPEAVARAADVLLIHFNNTPLADIAARIAALRPYGKPIVCNEDDKVGARGASAAAICAEQGASWGFMHVRANQHVPLRFDGPADDPPVYAALRRLSSPAAADAYFPPPESAGGWRVLHSPEEVRRLGGMDPQKLAALREWLLQSDEPPDRPFAAVVVRNGYVVLEIGRGLDPRHDLGPRGIASCAKAICATVLAVASAESQAGRTPRRMTFDDPAFRYLPWAHPLSDPRKARITVRQLVNHTSGLVGEWWQIPDRGVKNHGPWEWVLGHTGDWRTEQLQFDPGTDLEYTTHAFYHAALLCEGVTGRPYDAFAIAHLLAPLGIERWRFDAFDGDERHGRHPSHSLSLPAREMARIAYCMLRGGRWGAEQVIPRWFVQESGMPTHAVTGVRTFGREAQSFSHGWELPARLTGGAGAGIPADARFKPGTGGQLLAFVPSLDLVLTRMTGGSGGEFRYEECLRLACDAVLP